MAATSPNKKVNIKTPKKSRINYRDLEDEYSLGIGQSSRANNNPNAAYKKVQYISQKYIDYTPLARLNAKSKSREKSEKAQSAMAGHHYHPASIRGGS